MANEAGFYQNDPLGNLGRLKSELLRSVSLVVDTGIHAKKWSREKAIKYIVDVTGMDELNAKIEVENVMALPAQTLGYKMGMMNFIELRKLAKKSLGSTFDIRQFHDLILRGGPMSNKLLQKRVQNWISSQNKK